jgi:hypothetical protein
MQLLLRGIHGSYAYILMGVALMKSSSAQKIWAHPKGEAHK